MIFKEKIAKPIWTLFFLSLSGFLFHLRSHPIQLISGEPSAPSNWIPFVFGVLSVVLVPILFNFKTTSILAYLINGIGVILGSITMAHMSLTNLPETWSLNFILLNTSLSLILILIPKLFLGQMILNHFFPTGTGRLFTPFWWTRHFVYLSAVYAFGHFLWR